MRPEQATAAFEDLEAGRLIKLSHGCGAPFAERRVLRHVADGGQDQPAALAEGTRPAGPLPRSRWRLDGSRHPEKPIGEPIGLQKRGVALVRRRKAEDQSVLPVFYILHDVEVQRANSPGVKTANLLDAAEPVPGRRRRLPD
jgi:hypothetical protein